MWHLPSPFLSSSGRDHSSRWLIKRAPWVNVCKQTFTARCINSSPALETHPHTHPGRMQKKRCRGEVFCQTWCQTADSRSFTGDTQDAVANDNTLIFSPQRFTSSIKRGKIMICPLMIRNRKCLRSRYSSFLSLAKAQFAIAAQFLF